PFAAKVRRFSATHPGVGIFVRRKTVLPHAPKGGSPRSQNPESPYPTVTGGVRFDFFLFGHFDRRLLDISLETNGRVRATCGPPTGPRLGASSVAENASQPVSCNCS